MGDCAIAHIGLAYTAPEVHEVYEVYVLWLGEKGVNEQLLERMTIGEMAQQIANLSHLAWKDPANAQYLFSEIEKRALAIKAMQEFPPVNGNPIKERDTREMLNLIADQLRELIDSLCRAKQASDLVWQLDTKFIKGISGDIDERLSRLEKTLKERQDQDRKAISSWISICERTLSAKLDRIERAVAGDAKAPLVGKKKSKK